MFGGLRFRPLGCTWNKLSMLSFMFTEFKRNGINTHVVNLAIYEQKVSISTLDILKCRKHFVGVILQSDSLSFSEM